MSNLEEYKNKRDFGKTPEPGDKLGSDDFEEKKKNKQENEKENYGKSKNDENQLVFVVQKHWARRLHYDFRIEHKGVLKSWAVPKGISMETNKKQLAVLVEDHPFEYKNFEGQIPQGQYGAGKVIIWDSGTYTGKSNNKEEVEREITEGLKKGHVFVFLNGKKLKGGFNLVRMDGATDLQDGKNWLLIKEKDESSWTEMPAVVKPMLAELSTEPFDNEKWIYEIKWDGYRAISFLNQGNVQIRSRNDLPMDFPAIEDELKKIPGRAILDGEAVVLDGNGLPSFQLMQNYIKSQKGDLVYYVFDILHLNGHNLTGLPLLERKNILKQIIPDLKTIKFVDHVQGIGKEFYERARQAGLEGIVAKKTDSVYQQGKRSLDWVKIKASLRQEMVIGGFTKPRGGRKYFGSLLLGYFKDQKLVFAGHCGTGFNESQLKELHEKMINLKTHNPVFANLPKTNEPAVWIKPELVCEVKFSEWTNEGIMRAPVFLGLRQDKNPQEVLKESHAVKISNPGKIIWPNENYTKKDLVEYYQKMAPIMFPYLKGRPLVMHRFPNGIYQESFFQKNVDAEKLKLPSWVKTERIKTENNFINYIICENQETIIFLANLGCISMHPWNSKIESLENPDYIVLDYDAKQSTFENAVRVVFEAHKIMEQFSIPHYLKTSGGTGLHIFIPLAGKYAHEQAKNFAEIINEITFVRTKEITTLQRNPEKRAGKIYLDSYQNGEGKTLASVYSARPRKGATVSAPILWEELHGIAPENFTIKNIFDRVERKGDLWKPVLEKGIKLEKILEQIETAVRNSFL